MNNKELYKETFSKLHAGEIGKMEAEEMKSVKPKIRMSRRVFICVALLVAVAVVPCLSFAATDGQTANPVTAVKIYLNGKDIAGTATPNGDGTWSVELAKGDSLRIANDNDLSETEMKVAPGAPDDLKYKVTVPSDGSTEPTVEISDDGTSQNADPSGSYGTEGSPTLQPGIEARTTHSSDEEDE